MYVIAGVTGNTGAVVASTLLAAKQPVRVIVRDAAKGAAWQARGAEVAIADVADVAAMTAALRGATGAYVLLPPGTFGDTGIPARRLAQGEALVAAVRAAKPGHVVQLSSIGAQHAAGTGPIKYLHPIEAGLRASGVPTTFLRAAFFMENWGSMLKGAIDGGALYYGVREGVAFSQVATVDIGKTAARLLIEGAPAASRVVELSGPAEYSVQDVAATIGKIAGKAIAGVSIPPSAMVGALEGMGASKEVAALYGEMAEALASGHVAWEGTGASLRGAITLEARLRELIA